LHFFASEFDLCGGFGGEKVEQPPAEELFEIGDGLDAGFQPAGEVPGIGDAVAEKSKEPFEAMAPAKVGIEFGLELFELGVLFLLDEVFKRSRVGSGYDVEDAEGLAVVEKGGGQVGLVEGDKVFLEVVQAIDFSPDAPRSCWARSGCGGGVSPGQGLSFRSLRMASAAMEFGS
jgi:hypothetical protein